MRTGGLVTRARFLGIASALALATACTAPPPIEGEQDGLRTLHATRTSDGSGFFEVDFEVGAETSMLITLDPQSPYLAYVRNVYGPDGSLVIDGESWSQGDESLVGGVYIDVVSSLAWPLLSEDTLAPGTWTVEVGVTDVDGFFVSGATVAFEAQLKTDDDQNDGRMGADIVYVGPVIDDVAARIAIEEAVVYWQDIYASIGIELVPEYWELEGPDTVRPPGDGNAEDYIAIADQTGFRSVNVVVVEDIDSSLGGLYGISGGIPGPLVATESSAVAVSVLTNAGPDLIFSAEDVRLLGETMAHETGHFTGLSHPVEANLDHWDGLDDTPNCGSTNECEAALGDNLMFPYPVCDGPCTSQGVLSARQGDLVNRYVGVE
jgi:hypothetical protein